MKATRLNSFKVRRESFYAIHSGTFRTDLVYWRVQAQYRLSCVVCSVGVKVRNEPYRTYCWSEKKGRWAKHLDVKERHNRGYMDPAGVTATLSREKLKEGA